MKSALAGLPAISMMGLAACQASKENGTREINPAEFSLNEASISRLQEQMTGGTLTAVALCRQYLDRIAEADQLLNSVIELNPDALEIAAGLDEERRSGSVRGPLHGIPVLIKDNIDTGDRMMTTAGSLALAGISAPNDAFIVKKLREAGAVLLGKTNLSEWANIRSSRSSSGWSARGGQVRNPFCLDRSPCGSSSGTGAAVSANLCAVGIGTETDGSIVCPSGINGIVGIKPTLGLWSRDGIIPISHSQDTAGPMARTVTDAAILLGALAEFDQQDAETNLEKGEIFTDYTRFLDADGLKGARIGIVRSYFGFHSEVDRLMEQAINQLEAAGAVLVDKLTFDSMGEWSKAEWQVLVSELKADLNAYLSARENSPVKSLAELIEFNRTHADREMPWFDQEIFEEAQNTRGLDDPAYPEALKTSKIKSRSQGIDQLMDEHRLDALLAPTNAPAWPIDLVNGDHFIGGSSGAAAVAGYPNISVPAGYVHGLPVGISFFGRAWSEPVLLKIAYAYEQLSKHRRSPGFLKSIG